MPLDLDKYTQGEWLKGDDLEEGERLLVTINNVYEHTFPSGDVGPVIEFMETEKKLALNKTRVRKLVELLGDDTDAWLGRQVSLYPIDVSYNGKPYASVAITTAPKKKQVRVVEVEEDTDAAGDVIFGKN